MARKLSAAEKRRRSKVVQNSRKRALAQEARAERYYETQGYSCEGIRYGADLICKKEGEPDLFIEAKTRGSRVRMLDHQTAMQKQKGDQYRIFYD